MKNLYVTILFLFIINVTFPQWSTNGTSIYYNAGNVGIGTINPATNLSVYKSTSLGGYGGYPAMEVNNPNTAGNATSAIILRSGTVVATGLAGAVGAIYSYASSNSGQYIWFRSFAASYPTYIGYNQSDLNIINGNVGINTTDTKGYKLGVNGSAIFTKAVVKLNINWPDYVFEKNYKLKSLSSLEEYIKQNKHLPDMPSAEEMKKKDGTDLGEMNTKLLQKVEELTLYVIQLQKEIENLKKDNNDSNQ